MSLLLEACGLTRLYGDVLGVNDLSLAVTPGVRGLLGPNGAGKSTLMKLVMGLLAPTQGWIKVLGERPWNNPRLLGRLGYSPEHDGFYGFLSGLEFVTLLARMGGLSAAAARRKSADTLEQVGAKEFMERKISAYSKGMRQRTKLAQALVHDPEFVVLDEPLSGLDPIGRHDMIEHIRALGKQGRSVLVSSHVLHEVQAVTDEFLLMYGGRVLASGNVREIRDLMNQYPHRILLRASCPRRLGERLLASQAVTGVEIDEVGERISIRTSDTNAFYALLPELVAEMDISVREMVSEDDNLEAVFKYLVGGPRPDHAVAD